MYLSREKGMKHIPESFDDTTDLLLHLAVSFVVGDMNMFVGHSFIYSFIF